ncbi:isoaspartyl peptidase/L-asparaginase family protein [Ferruginibacter sp.]|nr:isoaspartyl peptidase/L-asparaginase [Ferruginibacter sp.]
MRPVYLLLFLLITAAAFGQKNNKVVLVIHGGAGTILKSQMTPEKEAAYNKALTLALQKGYDTLIKGGSALDAVEISVRILEDNPLFNAGKGSVFTSEGKNEMDAAIMNGETLAAGSIAGVTTIKNPISAARAVMEKSPHVMLAGKGAETFAGSVGLEIVAPSYFYTEERWQALQKVKKQEEKERMENRKKEMLADTALNKKTGLQQTENRDYKYGTVGAVALDIKGNLAAATSTGGMTNKKYGRIGDAPLIGAGTYANNRSCAVSCTGWGEYFIRLVMAKSVGDLMEYKNLSVEKASEDMILNKLPALGGDGGLIALDKDGNFSMPFNTAGMYRGYIKDGKAVVKIYKD